MDIPPNLTSLAKSRKKESCNGFFTHQSISQFSICAFYAKWALQMFKYEHIGWWNLKTFFWCLQLFERLSRKTKDTQAWFEFFPKVSTKLPGLFSFLDENEENLFFSKNLNQTAKTTYKLSPNSKPKSLKFWQTLVGFIYNFWDFLLSASSILE